MQELDSISLDGLWDFQFYPGSKMDEPKKGIWREAVVPAPWQAQFEDLRLVSGTAWYRRSFAVDADALADKAGKAAILHFGAVDYHAAVWVNGSKAGDHEGGYLPFEFDVIDLIHEGDNELLVRVVDSTDDRDIFPEYPFSEVPHGKQSWYGPIGGIWQSVWLELRPSPHISQLLLYPPPEDASIRVAVALSGTAATDYQVRAVVSDVDGNIVGSNIFEGASSCIVELDEEPKLWSADSPTLYAVDATLLIGDSPVHTASKSCGFRTIETSDGRILLNGEPVYLRGVLDQAYYPETVYSVHSLEMLEAQAREAKALGFNCLRTHIKIEDPCYYDIADRLGLLVWTEIPNWVLLTEKTARRASETFKGMVERDGHHPSIIIWTLINENWGTDLTRNEEHRRWLADFYEEAGSIDPTRLIVDNSACCDNAHVASDLEDFHYYRAIPDHARQWDEWVAQFAGRAGWVWYSDFEQERRSDLPLLVSEFGNWGLPDPETIREQGAEPWWFETGLDWGGGIVYPHGVLDRYYACGLGDLFPSYAEFARQSQEHMARSLHYEISTMRLHDSIAGYIITEFTDVHWECNGLLTMRRETKHLLDPLLKNVNQDRVVVLRPRRWSGRPGDVIKVTMRTMGISGEVAEGIVRWNAGQSSGELPVADGEIHVTLDSPGIVTLHTVWLDDDGAQLAVNEVNLICVPASVPSTPLRVSNDPALASVLRELGYTVSEKDAGIEPFESDVLVVTRYTRDVEEYIQQGGRVLYLADPGHAELSGRSPNISLPAGYVIPREGTAWQGDWATSFSWVKKEGALAHLPGGPILEMEWEPIMPDTVIDGLPQWVQRSHSWAGFAVGWIHKAVSLLTVMPYGRGRIVITTFKLNETTLAEDAIAQALFAGLVQLV